MLIRTSDNGEYGKKFSEEEAKALAGFKVRDITTGVYVIIDYVLWGDEWAGIYIGADGTKWPECGSELQDTWYIVHYGEG